MYFSSFGNMVISYLKEEERIAEKIRKSPCLYHKGKGIKKKIGKKAWREIFCFK